MKLGISTTSRTSDPSGETFSRALVLVSFLAASLTLISCAGNTGPASQTTKLAPTITAQPQSQTVTAGSTATFSVAATGAAPLSYQWQKGQTPIPGATSSSYTTPATVTGDSGSAFQVVVSNGVMPNAASVAATLTVNAAGVAPTITSQPQSQTVTVGGTATFAVVAIGTAPLSYQWQKGQTPIPGATSLRYTTPAAVAGDNGSTFQVVVSNGIMPDATSVAATLTVNAAGVAPTITAQPQSQTVTVGSTATFSVAATGTAPLSYQWQRGQTPIPGATSSSYTTPAAVAGDNGSTFQVVVSNGVLPNATSVAAILTVNAANVAPTITAQPQSQTVNVGSTATFSVTATGTPPLSYQWQKGQTPIAGATSSSYTTPPTAIGDNGSTFEVVASNGIPPNATSTAATLTVNPVQAITAAVLTYHNDNLRTGLNPNETILTTSNVASATFGKLGTLQVTGLVDAEPLYVPNLTIGGATHNIVFVVTEHDLAYAFDADTPGPPLWENTTLIPSTETSSDDRGCGQVQPEIGITSTPVIDLTAGPNGTIFLVTMSKDSSGNYHHRLHAVDLTTGVERLTAQEVQATFPGTGTGNTNGTQTFEPASYEERSALLLLNGTIYTTWTSHCDAPNYTSWLISFSESTLQRVSILNMTANGTTQNGQEGGIWGAGAGPAADASGFVYFQVGNGTFDTTLNSGGFPQNADYGNSFMKIATSGGNLSVSDYFAMNNSSGTAESESSGDTDLGSGGGMLLPDQQDGQGNTWHIGVGAGKDGNMYIVNRDNMGKFASNDANIYQELDGALSGGIWSAPAYFNGSVYYGPVGSELKAFKITNARLATSTSSTSPASFGYPGATPSVSANGTSSGIVWAIQNGSSTGVLHAYDATNLATELYNSNQATNGRDQFSTNSNDKFVTPMIANGKVYVETPGAVVVFGLLNP